MFVVFFYLFFFAINRLQNELSIIIFSTVDRNCMTFENQNNAWQTYFFRGGENMKKNKNSITPISLCFPPLFFYVYGNNPSTDVNESESLDSISACLLSTKASESLEAKIRGTSWLCKGSKWDYVNPHRKHYYEYCYRLNFGTDGTGTIRYEKQDTRYVYNLTLEKWHVTHHSTCPLYTFNYVAASSSTLKLIHCTWETSSVTDSIKTISKVTDHSLYVDFIGKYFKKS